MVVTMKIDQLMQKTTISAIENLYFIMMHIADPYRGVVSVSHAAGDE